MNTTVEEKEGKENASQENDWKLNEAFEKLSKQDQNKQFVWQLPSYVINPLMAWMNYGHLIKKEDECNNEIVKEL